MGKLKGKGPKGKPGGGGPHGIAPGRLESAIRSFDVHFKDVYGARWSALREALRQPVSHVARINRFAPRAEVCL